MSDRSKIEWCDATWNVVTGCTQVSSGCAHCYAKTLHDRRHKAYLAGAKLPEQYAKPFSTVQLHPERLEMPLHWKKPRKIFVNSTSDLFHEHLYDREQSFLNEVFAVMAATPHHTYQVLTKRPFLMERYLAEQRRPAYVEHSLETICGEHGWCIPNFDWPLPNVWVGTSISNQPDADEKFLHLLRTKAAVRFVSIEPMLGPVDLWCARYDNPNGGKTGAVTLWPGGLDWVICGGESGPNARPMHPDWARSLRDQCQAAHVPFFFKQWGEWDGTGLLFPPEEYRVPVHDWGDGNWSLRVDKKAAGRLLDGRVWNEFPMSNHG